MYNIHVIKILTGWSKEGGSTESFIRLTNELNARGVSTTLYGPDQWHINKCQGEILTNSVINNISPEDTVIVHFLNLSARIKCKKLIYVSHEKELYPVTSKHHFYDVCVFLNQKHRDFHTEYKGCYKIIPNIVQKIDVRKKKGIKNCAGIIGSIDENKQTHISILNAKKANYETINIYGKITDPNYFNTFVKPHIDNKTVFYKGFCDKVDIYSSVYAVFHSSKSECASLVYQECMNTNTRFYGNSDHEYDYNMLANHEIIAQWLKILSLNISIVIPAYNCSDHIEECLDSIKNQTLSDGIYYEILVGVDGCNSTLEKIKQIRHKYRNISVFNMKKNVGCYITLNTLISLTNYDTILILNADDIVVDKMLYGLSQVKSYDIIRWKIKQFRESIDKSIPTDIYANGAICIKRYIFNICGGYMSERFSCDLELLTRVKYFTKTVFIDNFLYYYRNGGSHKNLTSTVPLSTRAKFDNVIRSTDYGNHNVYVSPVTSDYTKV